MPSVITTIPMTTIAKPPATKGSDSPGLLILRFYFIAFSFVCGLAADHSDFEPVGVNLWTWKNT